MPAAEMRTATPEHESVLPGHVPPMLMPETRGEARLLLFFLNAGLFPTYQRAEEKEGGLGLSEAELMARGA